jgi:ATP dependent DNA ligase domain
MLARKRRDDMAPRAPERIGDPVIQSRPEYPDYITPCVATDIGRPPTGEKWVHEIKFDGFRSQLHLRNGAVTIYSRGGHDWTDRYRSVASQAAQLSAKHLIIDGEMVILREDGTCDFWALQKGARESISAQVVYFAFDLLYQDGKDVRRLPFLERKTLLRKALRDRSTGYATSSISRQTGRLSGRTRIRLTPKASSRSGSIRPISPRGPETGSRRRASIAKRYWSWAWASTVRISTASIWPDGGMTFWFTLERLKTDSSVKPSPTCAPGWTRLSPRDSRFRQPASRMQNG